MAKFFASTTPEISEREKHNMERARKIASQGMVLLSNNGALPLKETGNIALFGNGGRMTVKGGTGSGDVNSRSVVNVEQGLEEAGFTVTTKDWLGRYDTAVADAKAAYGAEMKAAVEKGGGMPILYIFDNPFKEPPIPPGDRGGLPEGGDRHGPVRPGQEFRRRKGQKAGGRGIQPVSGGGRGHPYTAGAF